jgi:hypothetical protein
MLPNGISRNKNNITKYSKQLYKNGIMKGGVLQKFKDCGVDQNGIQT